MSDLDILVNKPILCTCPWEKRSDVLLLNMYTNTKLAKAPFGANPGFLERGFICIKEKGVALLVLSIYFFVNIP